MMFDHYVTLAVAVEKTRLTEKELIQLAEADKITFAWLYRSSLEDVEMIVKNEDVERLQITRDRFEKEFGDQLISMSEAGRILGIPKTTIENWVKKGSLKRIFIDTLHDLPGGEEQLAYDRRIQYFLRLADVAYVKATQQFRKRGRKNSAGF